MSPLATVGILSIGDMGMGIAKLLIAHDYRVVTCLEGRSEDTHARVQLTKIEALPSDIDLVKESDYILSIVPPRDALSTAQRIVTASTLTEPKSKPLFYLDLNAISPRSARKIASFFVSTPIKFIDGGIIGGPPSLKTLPELSRSIDQSTTELQTWNKPTIPLSGPIQLPTTHLQATLNAKHITPEIGSASGLKCCFASMSKGFTALAIQSFTTASSLGVLPILQQELDQRMPALFKAAGGIINMPPKAYRWVREMQEIAICHSEEGGFEGGGKGIFDGVAEVYKEVAENEVLGQEKIGKRVRGTTVEDVAGLMGEGLRRKRRKDK